MTGKDETPQGQPAGRYAPVNGLELYYEVHGSGPPLVLLHGGLSNIDTDFGKLLPSFAKDRQVIAIDLQGHGRTADIDRPLSFEQLAEDVAALLRHLDLARADLFGYSMGGHVALQIAIRHPHLVRKLVVAAVHIDADGYYPEVTEGIGNLTPEDHAGSIWQEAYARIAPHPENWPALIAKVSRYLVEFPGWPPEAIRTIAAPSLVVVGDADVVRPEHAVELFRLLGGGVPGDLHGLPRSRLAVLPGTTHVTLVDRGDWLVSMIEDFLDAPLPDAA